MIRFRLSSITFLPLACALILSACDDNPTDPDPDPAPAVAEIRLAVDTLALYVGEAGTLGAVAYDSTGAPIEGADIEYTTSAPGIISVDETGAYTVQSHGSATLTATLDSISVTVPVRITRFVDVATMFDPLCALDGSGRVHCLGTEHHGNEFTPHPQYETWTQISGALPISDLTAGRWHACGLSTSQVYCWGANVDGQMGTFWGPWSATPVLADERAYHVVDAGWEHTCALDTAAAAWCWGRNEDGELGTGAVTLEELPGAVAGGHTWDLIDAGDAATCGVADDGLTYCWGNINGDSVPALVEGAPADLEVLRVAWRGACGAKGADVHCWGESDGWFPDPASVTLPVAVVDLVMGPASACALLANGEIHCWGSSDDGLLGAAGVTSRTSPARISSDEYFVAITGYQQMHCALTDVGAVYCWGNWPAGVVGPSEVPARVPAPRP